MGTVESSSALVHNGYRMVASGLAGSVSAIGSAATATIDRLLPEPAVGPRDCEASIAIREDSYDSDLTIVLTGCRTNGHIVSSMIAPALDRLGASATLVLPKRGCSYASIRDTLITTRQRFGARRTNVLDVSMGGSLHARLWQDDTFREGFGAVDSALLDSSPGSPHDIKLLPTIGLDYSRWGRRVPGSQRLGRLVSRRALHFSMDTVRAEIDTDTVDEQLAYEHRAFTHDVPPEVIASQFDTIMRHDVAPGSLAGFAQRIGYLATPRDAVVRTDRAALRYEAAVGEAGLIRIAAAPAVPETGHATTVDHPLQAVDFFRNLH